MKDFQKRIDEMVSKILKEEIEKKSEEMSEKLHGGQKKLDKNKNGRIDSGDFKLMRKKETKEYYFDDNESMTGDYEGDEAAENNAEELSAQEPTYVGRGLSDNKHGKMFGSFNDEHGFYDEEDRQYTGDFDFDFDEEEFDNFDDFDSKYGGKQMMFARGDEGRKFFDAYKNKFKSPFKVRTRRDMEEQETEEGNAFSGALADAKKSGKDSFEVDGKKYQVKEAEEKWIQKTDMKKGALRKKLGVPEGEKIPKSKLNSLKKELMTKSKGDKKLSASDAKLLKQVNLALTLGGIKENKETLRLTETELIDLIESIVKEQKSEKMEQPKDNIKTKTPIGLTSVQKANKKTGEVSNAHIKDTAKKMTDYMKDGSKEKFTTDPKHFPQGNGEMAEMKKKAYKASEAVKQYVDNFAYPGLENTHYDEIKPNDEWLTKNLEGSSETGNNTEWANAVDTGLGKKVNEKRKKNMYQKEKQKSYNKVAQPIETAGEHEGEKSLDKMFAKLESTENKKEKLISEDMQKMKNLITYNRKTQ